MAFNANTQARYVLFSRDTKLMNDLSLYHACKDLDLNNFSIPVINFIQGVPGCGKTEYIIRNHRSVSPAFPEGDLVLTTTKEGALDLIRRVQKRIGRTVTKRNYSTSHSYLINRRTKSDVVWIDEALMKHAGEIFMVALFSQCKVMHLLGDVAQIPFINRIATAHSNYSDPTILSTDITHLNVIYRCPRDVAAALSDLYPQGMRSTSDVTQSCEMEKISNLSAVPKLNAVYLTFKQEEKETLIKNGYPASTIHEYQGKQSDHIIIVRLSKYEKEQIYESLPHALVALSRHRVKLTYYTLITSDALSQLIQKTQRVVVPQKASPVSDAACDLQPVATTHAPCAPVVTPVFKNNVGEKPSPSNASLTTSKAESNNNNNNKGSVIKRKKFKSRAASRDTGKSNSLSPAEKKTKDLHPPATNAIVGGGTSWRVSGVGDVQKNFLNNKNDNYKTTFHKRNNNDFRHAQFNHVDDDTPLPCSRSNKYLKPAAFYYDNDRLTNVNVNPYPLRAAESRTYFALMQ